jgi:hypothetical protein
MAEKLKAVIGRWRERGKRRRADAQERRIRARENLRDFKPSGGHGGGVPGAL